MSDNDHVYEEFKELSSYDQKSRKRNILTKFGKDLFGKRLSKIKSKYPTSKKNVPSTSVQMKSNDVYKPLPLPPDDYNDDMYLEWHPASFDYTSIMPEPYYENTTDTNKAGENNELTYSFGYDPYKEIEKDFKAKFTEDCYDDANFISNSTAYDSAFKDKESKLANELIALCEPNKKEKDCNKSAKIFYELGVIYRQKSPDKFSLIRAAALFNASRVRSFEFEEKCAQRLYELGNHIQNLANADNKQNLLVKANKIAEQITIMRKTVYHALNALEQVPECHKRDELYNFEANKISKVRNIQHHVTNEYISIMSNLSAFCEHVMGEPPCLFSVIGMGSLARKEVTPYSDFEHVIVLKEDCQINKANFSCILNYFRWYSVIFHVVIINLKETIIPSVAIPSLNDDTSKLGNWFFDAFTKRGISFDGMMPHACKFPLGRPHETPEKPFLTELIKPVSQMLEYLNSDMSIKQGYHLGDILTKTCFVYGSKVVYNEFSQGVEKLIHTAYKNGCFDDLENQLKEDLTNFAVDTKTLNLLQLNKKFNLKRLIYRSTTLFISAWGRLEGINASSSFDIISALREKNLISSNQQHKLMYAVAIACEIRLRVYLEKDRQDDVYTVECSQDSSCHSFLNVVGKTSLINYFQIAYALQLVICQKMNIKPVHLIPDPNLLNVSVCSALGLQSLTNNLLHASISSTAPNVDIYNFDDCLSYLEEGIRLDFEKIDLDVQVPDWLSASEQNPKKIAYRYNYCAKYLYSTQNCVQAFDYVIQALKIISKISRKSVFYASCCELAGCCLLQMEKYNKAWFYFEEVLQVYEKLPGNSGTKTDVRIVLTYQNLAICLFSCNHIVRAKLYFHKALSVYTEKNLRKDIAETSFYIGSCLSILKKYTLSDLYLKESLKYFKEILNYQDCGKEYAETLLCLTLNHNMKTKRSDDMFDFRLVIESHIQCVVYCENCTAVTLFKLGKCLFDLEFFDFSYTFFMRCLQLYKIANVKTLNKEICVLYTSIGECLMKQDKHNESMVYLLDALAMFQRISENINLDLDVAKAFKNVGSCFLEMELFKDAHKNFQDSLSILKNLPAVENFTELIAALHNDIGVCLMEVNDFVESLKYLEKCVGKSSKLYQSKIALNNNTDVALNNLGKCLMKLDRHEEAIRVFYKALKMQAKFSYFDSKFASNNIAVTFNNIGICLMEMNEFQDSFLYFEKAERVCMQILESGIEFAPAARRQIADTLNNLGLNYMNIKDYRFAIKKFQAAVEYYGSISENSKNNSNIYVVWNNLGLCYMSLNLHQKALVYFNHSLKFFENAAILEGTKITIAALCNNIGLCLMQKKCEDSLFFFFKSLAIYQNEMPMTIQDVGAVLHNIALVYMSTGNFEESFLFLENALNLFQQSFKFEETNPNVSEIYHSMGICKKQTGDFAEALEYFERSLSVRQSLSPDDKDVLRTLYNGGMCLFALDHNKLSWFEEIYKATTLKFIKIHL